MTARQLLEAGKQPTITDVADAAQISRRTAYRYFPTQAKLLTEAVLEGLRPIMEAAVEVKDERGEPFEALAYGDERPIPYTSDELVLSGHRFFGSVIQEPGAGGGDGHRALGPAQRLHPRRGGQRRARRRAALRRGPAVHPQRRGRAAVLAGPIDRLRRRRRRRPHHDARLPPAPSAARSSSVSAASTARPMSSAGSA